MAAPKKNRMPAAARAGLIAVGGLVVLLGAAYAAGYALAGDGLPKDSVIAGVPVGGLTSADAEAKLRKELAAKEKAAITLSAGETTATVKPADAGLSIDYPASVAQAGGGRSANPVTIIETLFGGHDLPAVTVVDGSALDKLVSQIAAKVDVDPADAELAYHGTTPKVTAGKNGVTLDQSAAREAIKKAYLTSTSATAPVQVVEPEVTTAEAEQALGSLAKPAVAKPITVKVGDVGSFSLKPEAIAGAVSFVPGDGGLGAKVYAKTHSGLVKADLAKVGLKAPSNARFSIGQKKSDKPKVVPSKDGVGVDPQALADAIRPVLGETTDRTAAVATVVRPADFTTAEAKALGVKQVTGQFTTYFPGSAYRYNNIGKGAKMITGYLLKPGETFSLNKVLGERTPQAGWMAGGGIANGKIDPNIYGGGISQLTTTTFNAIFFAGLEDVYHKPHSLYFSRYPMGREATLDYRSVDLKFKNDSPYGVVLQAWTTGRTGSQGSVTVRVWSTKVYDIKATKPTQSNWRAPGKTVYDSSAKCIPQSAMSGFDVRYN
ncbi:MAG: VanW family protein, partial [Propionicimonas sp.]|nr:VanW family protein [Propionicimonas sp.]